MQSFCICKQRVDVQLYTSLMVHLRQFIWSATVLQLSRDIDSKILSGIQLDKHVGYLLSTNLDDFFVRVFLVCFSLLYNICMKPLSLSSSMEWLLFVLKTSKTEKIIYWILGLSCFTFSILLVWGLRLSLRPGAKHSTPLCTKSKHKKASNHWSMTITKDKNIALNFWHWYGFLYFHYVQPYLH